MKCKFGISMECDGKIKDKKEHSENYLIVSNSFSLYIKKNDDFSPE